jgi:hypothetical protein
VEWIIAALLFVFGVGLIVAGMHGTAPQLFGAITGLATPSGVASTPNTPSTAPATPPTSGSNTLPNTPAYPGLSVQPGISV